MSNLLHTLVTPGMVQGPATQLEQPIGRPDTLTSQHIEVSLVLCEMLGESCAADYLARHHVAPSVARRVLAKPDKRRHSQEPPVQLG